MTTLKTALTKTRRLFLDTAPVIYFIEDRPVYATVVGHFFECIDQGNMLGFVSPVTLAASSEPVGCVRPKDPDVVDPPHPDAPFPQG